MGIYVDYALNTFNSYSGSYIYGTSTNVLESCRNIGATSIKEYDGFNERGLIDIIHDSTLCVVTTHGNSTEISCGYHEITNNYQSTYINSASLTKNDISNMDLPDNYLSNTKCLLLTSCETGDGGTSSFAYKLHQAGVQVVVAFKETIGFDANGDGEILADTTSGLFNQYFLKFLGEGESVKDAAESACDEIYAMSQDMWQNSTYGDGEESEEDSGNLFGLDSYCFYGDENLVVKG